MKKNNRRSFLKKASLGTAAILSNRYASSNPEFLLPNDTLEDVKYGANDQINMAFIGCGIMGLSNGRTATKIPGVRFAAACDLYEGRLTRMKELFGQDIFTSKDYKEILERSDIDAVCVSTTDHWHDHIVKAALAAGKPVYCEKPMMHKIEEGLRMIQAEKDSGLPVQVGSQRASSVTTLKAKALYESGAIGQLIMADIRYDRASSNGAWQYSIPTDAGESTVDWDRFIGDAPAHDFDKTRFFRWRNYADYGTGVAGDLFVHLFTAMHVITSSKGPEKIYATGGLRYWKDGRDAPDVTLGLYDYAETDVHPAFNVQMRVNFVDGSGGGSHVRLIGTEGVMTLGWNGLELESRSIQTSPTYGGWDSYDTFSEKQQADFKQWFEAQDYPLADTSTGTLTYQAPDGYDTHLAHWKVFIDAIRKGTPIVEDTTFGMRAAAPSLAANMSMKSGMPVLWNPEKMVLR